LYLTEHSHISMLHTYLKLLNKQSGFCPLPHSDVSTEIYRREEHAVNYLNTTHHAPTTSLADWHSADCFRFPSGKPIYLDRLFLQDQCSKCYTRQVKLQPFSFNNTGKLYFNMEDTFFQNAFLTIVHTELLVTKVVSYVASLALRHFLTYCASPSEY
jgi:hypothetical protein